jgi:hypothetical protein
MPGWKAAYGNSRPGMALAASPGASPIGKSGLLVMTTNRQPSSNTSVLAHLFIAHRFPKAPLWVHEGLGEYLAFNGVIAEDRACYGVIKYASQPTVPLAKLLDTSWEAYDRDDARAWYQFTAQVLVHMIIHDGPGPVGHRMAPLFEAAAAGKSNREVLEAAYPDVPLESLQKMFDEKLVKLRDQPRDWCPLPVRIPPPLRAEKLAPAIGDAPTDQLRVLMNDLDRLPARQSGFQAWYPPEVVTSVK